jgi:hypothetical protein
VYSPADIFAHTLLHERQHHGDVHTLLYQLGIEVPIVEYRFSLPERATWGGRVGLALRPDQAIFVRNSRQLPAVIE